MTDTEGGASAPATPDPLLTDYLGRRPGAEARLFEAYAPFARAAISRYLALRGFDQELANDLTHDLFLALFRDDGRRLRHFEGRGGCSFAGWLRVVAVRLTIDVLRRERRMVSLDEARPDVGALSRALSGEADDPAAHVEGAETWARLKGAIGQLGAKDRLLVELHLLRGVDLSLVAQALAVTPNAAYIRKSRVLARLRAVVAGAA